LYISPLFSLNLKYAISLNPDLIFILSAKYGVVEPDDEIEPYDFTLNDMRAHEIKTWADSVLRQLQQSGDLQNDRLIFLAGARYRKYLIPYISIYDVPLQGLAIGKQLQFLKSRVSNE